MKKILMHICCGNCSITPVQELRAEGYEVVGYFANPNIHPISEYLRRRESAEESAKKINLPMIWQDNIYNLHQWLEPVYKKQLSDNKDGSRCFYCYKNRLQHTQEIAVKNGFATFSTSLLYSRHQRHELILTAGKELAEKKDSSIPFFYRDFRNSWQKGIDTSKEWGLYRQNYCGCIFSESERFQKKLDKLHLKPSISPTDQRTM